MDISIVIPLLNEEESLTELSQKIDFVLSKRSFQYETIFIDDGSNDKSWSIIEKIAANNSNVKGIKFLRNFGKSQALHAGFNACVGNIVFTMDADLQDDPEEIPEIYDLIINQDFDLISGWKKQRFDPIFTKNIPSKLFNACARITSGINLNDFNCGLKAYKKKSSQNN